MDYYSNQISRLIEEFSRLSGNRSKSAQRLAFHIINMPKDQVENLAKPIVDARNNVRYCAQCATLTDRTCPICSIRTGSADHHGSGLQEIRQHMKDRKYNECIMCSWSDLSDARSTYPLKRTDGTAGCR